MTGDDRESKNRALVMAAFERQVGGSDSFYSILAENVHWTVASATPTSYEGRRAFLEQGAAPVLDGLTSPIQAEVKEVYTDGDTVLVWWQGSATALNGEAYRNQYLWILTVKDDLVTRVVAFLDTTAIYKLVHRSTATSAR